MKKRFLLLFVRNFSVAFFDYLAMSGALLIGYWLWVAFPWHGNYQPLSAYAWLVVLLPIVGIWIFYSVGLYKPETGIMGVEEQSLIFKAIWILYAGGFALTFFYREITFSRLATLYSVFIAIALVSIERFLIRHYSSWLNQKDFGARNVLIYGAGHQGQRLERWIRQSPNLGLKVLGYLDDDIETLVKVPTQPPILGGFEDLAHFVKNRGAEMLVIAHKNLEDEDIVGIFQSCRELGIQCWLIPSLYEFHVEHARLLHIGGIPLVGFREGVAKGPYLLIKRILDLVGVSLLVVLCMPLFIAIYITLKVSSKEPVFFKQIRVGKDGKKFTMIKFRTLKSTGDAVSPELKGESQFLPFGKFLRQSGLDELPQLFLVLKGDMSLIGPRPEMPFIVEQYGPLEKERLTVKPGITGLWQISEDRKKILIHENMDYDLYYIERISFNLDFAILIKTIFTVLNRILNVTKVPAETTNPGMSESQAFKLKSRQAASEALNKKPKPSGPSATP